jgi:YihY family inner membrane protein
VVRGTVEGVRSDQITFIAASLAYYAFVSLLPLLLLGIVAASVVGGADLALTLAEAASDALGPDAGTLVRTTLTDTAGQAGASLAGVGFLAWSALKLFRGLKVAFATVYGRPTAASFLVQVRDALAALIGVGVGVAATVGVAIAVTFLDVNLAPGIDLVALLGTPLLVLGLTLAFLPLYYLLPGVSVGLREALPGAVLAAVGWTLLQAGFRVYAATTTTAQVYGVLGAVLLLLTFLYVGGLVLLVGVVLNAVLAGREEGVTGNENTVMRTGATDEDDHAAGDTRGRDAGDTRTGQTVMTDETDTERTDTTESTGGDRPDEAGSTGDRSSAYDGDIEAELDRLYDELDRFEERFEDGVVHREEIEEDLQRYVRGRMRRGKARGWGPYLVLLYGTAMTLGAFYFLAGGWAILAMLVVWLSTLGLYALMLLVGVGVGAVGLPGRLRDRLGAFRD